MKSIQFYLTPAAGKRLIGMGIAARPDVKKALTDGTILVIAGTTNVYPANELLAACGSDLRADFGSFHRGITLPRGYKTSSATFSGDLVIEKGVPRFVDDLPGVCAQLKKGDIILKGANAYNPDTGETGVLIGNAVNGGTIMQAAMAVVSRRAKLIMPVGLEKRVSTPIITLCELLNDPEGGGLRMMSAPGEAFSEAEAIALLTGCRCEVVGSGGVAGAEGGIYLQAWDGDLDALGEIVKTVINEPATVI